MNADAAVTFSNPMMTSTITNAPQKCEYCGGPVPTGWPSKAHGNGVVHYFRNWCEEWAADHPEEYERWLADRLN